MRTARLNFEHLAARAVLPKLRGRPCCPCRRTFPENLVPLRLLGRKVELAGRILTIDNFVSYTNLFVCRDSQGRIEGPLVFGSTSFSFSFVGVRLTF